MRLTSLSVNSILKSQRYGNTTRPPSTRVHALCHRSHHRMGTTHRRARHTMKNTTGRLGLSMTSWARQTMYVRQIMCGRQTMYHQLASNEPEPRDFPEPRLPRQFRPSHPAKSLSMTRLSLSLSQSLSRKKSNKRSPGLDASQLNVVERTSAFGCQPCPRLITRRSLTKTTCPLKKTLSPLQAPHHLHSGRKPTAESRRRPRWICRSSPDNASRAILQRLSKRLPTTPGKLLHLRLRHPD
jgi:hypothetical protein